MNMETATTFIILNWSGEEWPRLWSRKILGSTPPMGTPKLQLFTEQLLMWNDRKLTQKIYNYKYKERTTWRWLEGQRCGIVKTHTPRWATHNQEENTIAKVLSKEQGVQAPHQSPQPGSFCTKKTSPWNIWLWRPVQLTFRRARGLWEIDSTLKGHAQNLTRFRTQGRNSNLKEAWVRPTC